MRNLLTHDSYAANPGMLKDFIGNALPGFKDLLESYKNNFSAILKLEAGQMLSPPEIQAWQTFTALPTVPIKNSIIRSKLYKALSQAEQARSQCTNTGLNQEQQTESQINSQQRFQYLLTQAENFLQALDVNNANAASFCFETFADNYAKLFPAPDSKEKPQHLQVEHKNWLSITERNRGKILANKLLGTANTIAKRGRAAHGGPLLLAELQIYRPVFSKCYVPTLQEVGLSGQRLGAGVDWDNLLNTLGRPEEKKELKGPTDEELMSAAAKRKAELMAQSTPATSLTEVLPASATTTVTSTSGTSQPPLKKAGHSQPQSTVSVTTTVSSCSSSFYPPPPKNSVASTTTASSSTQTLNSSNAEDNQNNAGGSKPV